MIREQAPAWQVDRRSQFASVTARPPGKQGYEYCHVLDGIGHVAQAAEPFLQPSNWETVPAIRFRVSLEVIPPGRLR